MSLSNLYTSLNITEDEFKTYRILLQKGYSTVGHLAKKLNKPRTSLYGFLRALQQKGLISQSFRDGVKTFCAESPEKIQILLNKRLADIHHSQQFYSTFITTLKEEMLCSSIVPKFKLYEQNNIRSLLMDMFLYSDIEIIAFWPIKKMLEVFSSPFIDYHNRERIKNNIYARVIWPETEQVDIKNYPYLNVGINFKREIRITDDITSSVGYIAYKNKTLFVTYRENFAYIIESKEITDLILNCFENVWRESDCLKFNKSIV